MSAEKVKEQVSDSALDGISGGNNQKAHCGCPFCGNWIIPTNKNGKDFCPVCGNQIGGAMTGGSLF